MTIVQKPASPQRFKSLLKYQTTTRLTLAQQQQSSNDQVISNLALLLSRDQDHGRGTKICESIKLLQLRHNFSSQSSILVAYLQAKALRLPRLCLPIRFFGRSELKLLSRQTCLTLFQFLSYPSGIAQPNFTAGLRHLGGMTNLHFLNISESDGITDDGILQFLEPLIKYHSLSQLGCLVFGESFPEGITEAVIRSLPVTVL